MVLVMETRAHDNIVQNGYAHDVNHDWFNAETGPFVVKRKRPSLYRADSNDNIDKSLPELGANDIACGMFWNSLALIACFCATFVIKVFCFFKKIVIDPVTDLLFKASSLSISQCARGLLPSSDILQENYNIVSSHVGTPVSNIVDYLSNKVEGVSYSDLKDGIVEHPGFALFFGVFFCSSTLPIFLVSLFLFCVVSFLFVGFLMFEGTLLTIGTLMMGGMVTVLVFLVATIVVFIGLLGIVAHQSYKFIVGLSERIFNYCPSIIRQLIKPIPSQPKK